MEDLSILASRGPLCGLVILDSHFFNKRKLSFSVIYNRNTSSCGVSLKLHIHYIEH